MAMKHSDPSAISTSSVLDALNSDEYKEPSESEDDNASEATDRSIITSFLHACIACCHASF